MSYRSFKKVFLQFMIFILLLQAVAPVSAADQPAASKGNSGLKLTDKLPAWAEQEINGLVNEGIIQGFEDGTFQPERAVTRAETAVWLARLTGNAKDKKNGIFPDVSDQWFASDVNQAASLGIIKGYADGNFHPNDDVNRFEIAVMLNRMLKLADPNDQSFTDKGLIPEWASPSVSALHKAGVIQGYDDGAFHGDRKLTRAEAAVIVHRAGKLAEMKGASGVKPESTLLTVKVNKPDGSMLVEADVFIHEKGKRMFKAWGRTNEQGDFAVSIPFGNYDVHILKDGYVAYQPVLYEEGHTSFEIAAGYAAEIEGKVIGSDGKPSVGILLSFTTNPTFYAVTGVDGMFRANVLPEKTYRLTLLEDKNLSRLIAEGGRPEDVFAASAQTVHGLSLLDSEQSQLTDCDCRKYDAVETYTSLGVGQKLQMGSISIDGARAIAAVSSGRGSSNNRPQIDLVPNAPTGLTGTAGNGSVQLSWAANSEADLAGYKVYVSADNGATWDAGTIVGRVASHIASGLTNGALYRFAVTAYDASGNESAKSATADVRPQQPSDTTPPSAPTGLTGTAGNGSAQLNWAANSEADLAGYKVYVSADNGATWDAGTNVGRVASHIASGLTNGALYRFAVTAYDASGNESAKSTTADVTPQPPPDTTPPAKPTGLDGEFSNGFASLTWSANSESDLAGYKVYMSTDNGDTWVLDGLVSLAQAQYQKRITGAVLFAVTAYDGAGNESSRSEAKLISPPPQVPPSVPADVVAVAGNGKAQLNWRANTETDIAGYNVYVSGDGGTTWQRTDAGNVTTYTVTGLVNGKEYVLAVTAYNNGGSESEKSAGVKITPQAPSETTPAVPAGFGGLPGDTFVSLSWTANSEPDLAGYHIFYSMDNGTTWSAGPNMGKATAASVKGLKNGRAYLFAVTAYDVEGNESDRSLPVSLAPVEPSSPPPDPVTVASQLPSTALPSFDSTVKFLYTGSQPLQTGVDEGAIIAELVSVIRGKVLDAAGLPLAGVLATILNHDELGVTRSRTDGMFDLAVNGGGIINVQLSKEGYMPVQRKITVTAGDYAALPDVVLKAYDTKVTVVDLKTATDVQVAQGSPVTDGDGARRPTVVIPEGTAATMKLPNGSVVPLTEIHLRATEYTVGENGLKSMPGDLPDYVGYTHAIELSADEAVQAGATEVRFNQRLYYYVENYLEFPVGGAVPMGYYDREEGRWVASNNGKIIGIVSVDGGIASIDTDGDGAADSSEKLRTLGFTDKERQKLAGIYTAGQSLWRVPIEHFTPWDCNWPYGPPLDAEPPIDEDPKREEEEDPCEQVGSIIGCQNQSLGQAIPIDGTGMNLNYISTRTPGNKEKSKLIIPVSGNSIPSSLLSMSVTIDIGGKSFKKTFSPAPNVTHTLQWDGIDAYARKLIGKHPYKVTVTNHYGLQYYAARSDFEQSFGRLSGSGVVIGAIREFTQIPLSRVWYGSLESPNNPFEQAGVAGWSLDAHHMLNMEANIIYEGDRNKKTMFYNELRNLDIRDRLGNDYGLSSDIAPGPGKSLYFIANGRNETGDPYQIVARLNNDGTVDKSDPLPVMDAYRMLSSDLKGNVYLYSPAKMQIYQKKFDKKNWTVFAGTGKDATNEIIDGSVAAESDLPRIFSIAGAADGNLYFTGRILTSPYNILHRISTDGRIQVMGSSKSGADSGRANNDTIGKSSRVVAGSDGSVYIEDSSYSYNATRIRKISPDGLITMIAGVSPDDYSTERVIDHGVPAKQTLFSPNKMFIDGEGNLMIEARRYTWEAAKLYRINKEGIVEEINFDHANAAAKGFLSLSAIDYNGNFIFNNDLKGAFYRVDRSYFELAEFPEEDGLSVNVFDRATGRIMQNVSALSGAELRMFGYDNDGRLLSITERNGNLIRIERDAQGKPTAIVAPGGQRTILEVDGSGELISITNPAGETYRMKYAGGLLTEYTDPEQGVSQYAYDEFGKLVQAVDPEGGVKTLQKAYINNGNIVTFTDPSNRKTTYETVTANGKTTHTLTDPSGYKTVTEKIAEQSETATLPDGTKVSKKFGTDPRMGKNTPFVAELTYTSPDGKVTNFKEERSAVMTSNNELVSYKVRHTLNGDVSTIEYVRASHKFTDTTAGGTVTETYLDAWDRVSKVAWPGADLFPIESFYDSIGRLERVQQGEKFVQYSYNSQNLIEKETDAFGSVKKYEYDDAGRITSITTPGNRVYRKDYDGLGNFTGLTMPDNSKYVQQFNKRGQFDGFAPQGSGLWYNPEHDNGGNLVNTVMRSGRAIDHVLESGEGKRPVGINDADIQRKFTYLGKSDFAKTIESVMPQDSTRSQKIEYGYKGESIDTMVLAGKANASFNYEYDGFFNLTNIGMTVGGAVYNTPFQYDKEDNLTKFGPFQFKRGGPLKAVGSMDDGKMDIQVDYDRYGKIDSVTYLLKGSQVYKAHYAYDARDFVTDIIVDSAKGKETTHYEYDLDGQLKGMTRMEPGGNAVTEVYSYDVNKNRITSLVNGAAQVVSVYGEHDVLERVGSLAYTFDVDGFLKQRGSDTYSYGVRGELLEATVNSAGSGFTTTNSVTGGTYNQSVTGVTYMNALTNGTYKYTYDGIGRRVAKEDSQGRKTQYLYGNPESLHLLTASVDPNGQLSMYYYNEMGLLIALERGGTRYYVVSDAVGTPQRVLDSDGAVVKELRYDSYGGLQSDSNPAFVLLIGYAGGLEDRDTGLIRFGFRDYDPVSGRWTARDSVLLESGQTNLYAYVNNNPIMFRDPCGQVCVGASVYAVVGIGGKVCIDSEGVSSCVDTGFGVGLGIEVSPFEDIAKNEFSMEAMAKLTAGIGNLQAGYKLGIDFDTNCRTDGPIARAEAGPYRVDLLKPKKSAVKGNEDNFQKTIKELFKKSGVKAEASIKAKVCRNLRW
ncbi:fibronectin type III domain-containing protein [Paenibacillus radicis (ex Xue et al. 2023)]|uniref:Fibronectin type III domain-containing protein n=1 Tax=Paenibacillus radicis (ex Xue et al. 2023) TaxID=2972489 RepID=A0ABT1YN93_9BACL|nr:fibronectin type III domain-containing protein [Paenibacillus radicis (ex Xue et al. 2023)]MCR8634636.1 fibronectin type III domain-containing protein [Paenibacillus radicis (ex Xue et al. 2023)]